MKKSLALGGMGWEGGGVLRLASASLCQFYPVRGASPQFPARASSNRVLYARLGCSLNVGSVADTPSIAGGKERAKTWGGLLSQVGLNKATSSTVSGRHWRPLAIRGTQPEKDSGFQHSENSQPKEPRTRVANCAELVRAKRISEGSQVNAMSGRGGNTGTAIIQHSETVRDSGNEWQRRDATTVMAARPDTRMKALQNDRKPLATANAWWKQASTPQLYRSKDCNRDSSEQVWGVFVSNRSVLAARSGGLSSNNMTKAQYQVYLQSDHWKSLRRAKLEQAGYRCQICGSCYCLQVHHLKYRNIYDVTLQDLKVVCRYCHEKEHGIDSGFRPIKPDVSELLKHELNVPKRFPVLPTSIVKRMTPEEAKAQIAKNKQKKHERKALWAYDKAWKRSDELSGR